VARHAAADDPNGGDDNGLVLAYSFDEGKAVDTSGKGSNGTVEKATSVEGRFGRALMFVNAGNTTSAAQTLVDHRWSADLPLMPRAMVLAGDVLFIAGPPDLVDEEQAAQTLTDPATQASLLEHAAALDGRKGALLWAVSASDGQRLAEQRLDAPPVFDGMAAAAGKLLLVTVDGKVLCFGP
jgi:hypothetical protein